MTAHYSPNEIITLEEFGGISYLIPNKSKHVLLDQILPHVKLLNGERGNALENSFCFFRDPPHPFDPLIFHACSSVVYKRNIDVKKEVGIVKRWLISLPIDGDDEIYVYRNDKKWKNSGCSAFVVTWRVFTDIVWRYCIGGFDIVHVVDDTGKWAITFGPEDAAIYILRSPVARQLPIEDNAYGWDLIRVQQCNDNLSMEGFVRRHLNQVPCSCKSKCLHETVPPT